MKQGTDGSCLLSNRRPCLGYTSKSFSPCCSLVVSCVVNGHFQKSKFVEEFHGSLSAKTLCPQEGHMLVRICSTMSFCYLSQIKTEMKGELGLKQPIKGNFSKPNKHVHPSAFSLCMHTSGTAPPAPQCCTLLGQCSKHTGRVYASNVILDPIRSS